MGFLNSSIVSLLLGPLVRPRQPKLPRTFGQQHRHQITGLPAHALPKKLAGNPRGTAISPNTACSYTKHRDYIQRTGLPAAAFRPPPASWLILLTPEDAACPTRGRPRTTRVSTCTLAPNKDHGPILNTLARQRKPPQPPPEGAGLNQPVTRCQSLVCRSSSPQQAASQTLPT